MNQSFDNRKEIVCEMCNKKRSVRFFAYHLCNDCMVMVEMILKYYKETDEYKAKLK